MPKQVICFIVKENENPNHNHNSPSQYYLKRVF